jgi:hypothetical protein
MWTIPCIGAQMPAKTSSVYALSVKSWPLVQNARITLRVVRRRRYRSSAR